jgi:hypothetical protein
LSARNVRILEDHLTPGEQFVEALPKKLRFYDRNERRSYELTRAVAARLVDDPALVRQGLAHAKRHMGSDASQARYFVMWEQLLKEEARAIARQLLEDTPRGALLRDTQPVFCVLPPEVRQAIILRARTGPVTAAASE